MKAQMIFFVVLTMGITALAQAPDTLWTRTFGGPEADYAKCVQETDDGGFIIAGTWNYTYYSTGQAWLIKTDAWGDTVWTKKFGSSDRCTCGEYVQQTHDGGYILCGFTDSWGAASRDAYLLKTDSNGNCQWIQNYGADGVDEVCCVQQTPDHGYITVGNTTSWGGCDWDLMAIKTDSLGNEDWIQVYPGYSNYWDYGLCVRTIEDGGYIISGKSAMNMYSYDFLLMKIDSDGYTVWLQTYGTDYHEAGRCVQQTLDQGFIVVGEANDESLNNFMYLVKTDTQGDTMWTRRYYVGSSTGGNSLQLTTDRGYIIGGYSGDWHTNNAFLMKTDVSGDSLWSLSVGGEQRDLVNSVQQTSDGGYILAGSSESYGPGDEDIWVIRVGSETAVEPDPAPYHPTDFVLDSPYPNPFNATTVINYRLPVSAHVRLAIYNVSGQLVTMLVDGDVGSGHNQVVWNAGDSPSGIYFCRLSVRTPMGEAGKFAKSRKIVLLK